MNQLWWWAWIMALMFAANSAGAGSPRPADSHLEIRIGQQRFQGRELACGAKQLWLLANDGQLHPFDLNEITEQRTLTARFAPLTPGAVRDLLRRELGNGFEVAGAGRYLVCARPGEAPRYARLFDDLYRAFRVYFAARGFQVTEPEFPLVAIVFPDQAGFARYAQRDHIPAIAGLQGYYHPQSNRVTLFESGNRPLADGTPHVSDESAWWGSIQGGGQATMVHEATHQVAFNTGLHARIGQNPKWVVEGLATVFEAPGIRQPDAGRNIVNRINPDRFAWFIDYAQRRRKAKSLAGFIADDQPFVRAALDAYSEAWALSFFLIETRSSQYSRYLKVISRRDPLKHYGPEERTADFQQAFGSDLVQLDADLLRFLRGIR